MNLSMSPSEYLRLHLEGPGLSTDLLQALTVRLSFQHFVKLRLLANHLNKSRTRVASQSLECAIDEMWDELAKLDPELVHELNAQAEEMLEDLLADRLGSDEAV